MRKYIFVCLLFLICGSSFASYQYGLNTIGTKYPLSQGPYGLDFKLTVKEASTIYLSDILKQSPQFTSSVNVKNNDYGWIDLSTGKRYSGDSSVTKVLENGVTAYKLGDFSAGTEVGIWVKNTNQNLASSVFGREYVAAPFNYRTVENELIGNLQFTNSSTIRFLVSGEPVSTPAGQPLPGILATLLIGGCGLAMLRRRGKTA